VPPAALPSGDGKNLLTRAILALKEEEADGGRRVLLNDTARLRTQCWVSNSDRGEAFTVLLRGQGALV
jgi:hypothetical protein